MIISFNVGKYYIDDWNVLVAFVDWAEINGRLLAQFPKQKLENFWTTGGGDPRGELTQMG